MTEHFFEKPHEESKKEPTIHVEENQIFFPFRGASEFLPHDFDQDDEDDNLTLLYEQNIEFKGIFGNVGIYGQTKSEETNSITPLGPARFVSEIENGREKLTEIPCVLLIEFFPKNYEQFKELSKYSADFFINDEVYFLDCDGGVDNEFAFKEFRSGDEPNVYDSSLKENPRKTVNVLFPMDLSALKNIRMKIKEYDDDDDDDEGEEADLPPSQKPNDLLNLRRYTKR